MTDNVEKTGWTLRLKAGLEKSSRAFSSGIGKLLSDRKLGQTQIDELEELLIRADLGIRTASAITQKLKDKRFEKDISQKDIKLFIATEISKILTPIAQPFLTSPINKPHVILVCGVNGSGKTTTIGKLAYNLVKEKKSVIMCAADTFRAAASEQLMIWGSNVGCKVVSQEKGSDPAGVVFDAIEIANKEKVDALLIDTAGRLQNKTELMEELTKITRVIKKRNDTGPHSSLLVLDSTVGQNAHSQVDIFHEMIGITGLILTKLDGTAKGGVIVSLADKHGLPIHAIGVGEQIDDLRPFNAEVFSRMLLGL